MLRVASRSSPPSMWRGPWCGEPAAYEAAASSLLGRGGEWSSSTFPASSLLGIRLTLGSLPHTQQQRQGSKTLQELPCTPILFPHHTTHKKNAPWDWIVRISIQAIETCIYSQTFWCIKQHVKHPVYASKCVCKNAVGAHYKLWPLENKGEKFYWFVRPKWVMKLQWTWGTWLCTNYIYIQHLP